MKTMQCLQSLRTVSISAKTASTIVQSSRCFFMTKQGSFSQARAAVAVKHCSSSSFFSKHPRRLCSLNQCSSFSFCESFLCMPKVTTSDCRYIHTGVLNRSGYKISSNDKDEFLNIESSTNQLTIPYIWLRDHCRSSKCYNHSTNQKNVDPDLLKRDLTPSTVKLSQDKEGIIITWQDGHVSEFTFNFLEENFYPGYLCRRERKLWDKSISSEKLPTVSYQEHMSSENGLKQSLSNLVKYGFTIVNKAPANLEGTQEVVERVSFILETMFGRLWSFTSNASRSDTSYSTQGLGAHTDTTYLTTPAGIQVFQCLEHTGSGGETLLVDGFHALEQLRKSQPAAFELLRTTVVPHEYKEEASSTLPGCHSYSLGTVVTTHPASGELLHLRFNPYDRAPLNTVPPKDIPAFYEAYDKLARIIANSNNEFWIKLVPGSILIIDNWRVLHGRSAFDGKRVMCGCYLPRDDWISKAKFLGVL